MIRLYVLRLHLVVSSTIIGYLCDIASFDVFYNQSVLTWILQFEGGGILEKVLWHSVEDIK